MISELCDTALDPVAQTMRRTRIVPQDEIDACGGRATGGLSPRPGKRL